MRWYSREFLKHLRRRVWREAQTRPDWRKTAWRNRLLQELPRFEPVAGSVIRVVFPWLFISIAIVVGMFSARWAETQASVLWLLLIWWGLVFAPGLANHLLQLASGGSGVSVLTQYPVNSLRVWDAISARVFRTSLWLIYDALMVFWFACNEAHVRPVVWFAAGIAAVVFWASVLALAVVLYGRRWPWSVYAFSALLLFAVGPVVAITQFQTGHLTSAQIAQVHGVLASSTPPGWACQLAEWLTGARADFPFVAVGLLVTLLAWALLCYRHIRERYTFWSLDEPAPIAPREEPAAGTDAGMFPEDRVDAIEQRVKSRAFLLPRIRQHSDSLSRRIIPASPRKEAIVDFLVGGRAYWVKPYVVGAGLVLLAPLPWKLLKVYDSDGAAILLGVTLLIGLSIATLYSSGLLTRSIIGTQQSRPISPFALLPIGARETDHVLLRVNVLRLIATLPCWLLAGAWMAFPLAESLLSGLRLGGLAWLVALLLQPGLAGSRHSRGIKAGFLGAMASLMLAMLTAVIVAGVVYLVATHAAWGWQAAALAALGLTSWGTGTIYRRYLAPRFDMFLLVGQLQPLADCAAVR
jgi:hypothetical protein